MKFTKEYSKITAILFFAKSENSECNSKPITCQQKQDELLWKTMNEHGLKTIQKTNLPYFISDETSQIGNTFGDKITYSIQKIFNKGFEKVIVIGNDCIELQADHLLEASRKLQTDDFVLGADFNGGAYLIGVSKKVFNADEFKTISWQTPSVFDELLIIFSKHTLELLPCLNDCNSRSDFKKALHKLSFSNPFKILILSILQNKSTKINYVTTYVSYQIALQYFNKGSPFYL